MRAGRVWTAKGTEAVAPQPHIGHIVSGAGHLGLIGWMLFGGAFAPAPEPFDVTEVAVISGTEFAAMVASAGAPAVTADVAPPVAPVETAVTPPVPPVVETRPQPRSDPTPAEPPPAEASPAPPQPTAELTEEAPVIASPVQDVVVLAPERSTRPVPRPVDRVAPVPVAQPDPETRTAETPEQAVTPEPAPATPPTFEPPREAAQPEEATTEIATEAKDPPSAAPVQSVRPKSRPAAVRAAETPRETPAETPAVAAAAQPAARDPVADALAEALAGAAAPAEAAGTGRAASGPPLTAGEKDALRVAVQACWNVVALSTDALRVTVTVAVQLDEGGRPLSGSIRMLGFEGGSDAAARQAFDTARRAISRCGASGFDLPRDKYDQWRDIEMVFNPEKMRIK